MRSTIIVGCLILIACHSEQQKTESQVQRPEAKIDSTYFQILGIDDLSKNLSNTQIRITIEFSLSDTGHIFNIKDNGGAWKGEFYRYRFDLDERDNKKNVLLSRMVTEAIPKSGWNSFLEKVEKIGLYTLEDKDRKRNYGLCTDANIIKVEIEKNGKYNEYVYPCWEVISDQTQINKIKEILEVVKAEFNFQVFPKDYENVGLPPKQRDTNNKPKEQHVILEDIKSK